MAEAAELILGGDTDYPRPYPQRTEPLPIAIEAVTPEWLTRTLANRYPGVEVRGFEDVELRNGHTTKWRVALDLNQAGIDAGIPRNVCLKANWSGGFAAVDIHRLEACFYFHARDHLDVPAPRAYYADWDEGVTSGQGVVVMEDLVLDGGEFGNSNQKLGIDGVAKALESLAVLHGAWWDSPALKSAHWLPQSMGTPIDTEQLRYMYNWVQKNTVKPEYQAVLPAWLYETPDRFHAAFDALVAYEQAQGPSRCIVHGDSHVGNSYVRPTGERVWLDWQLVRQGRPWRDFAYITIASLTVEERRQAERSLIDHYLGALKATGATNVPSAEEFWGHLRRWPVYGMQSWIANVDAWGQAGLHVTQRFFKAAEDFDSLKLLGV